MSLPKAEEWTDPGSMDPLPPRGKTALIVLGACVVAVVGSIVVWRFTTLRGLPDVGPPFDLKAQGHFDIPEAENAFTYYRAASAKLSSPMPLGPSPQNWVQAPPVVRDWFDTNRDALRLWLAGTTKDQAVYIQPNELSFETRLKVAQDMRSLSRLGLLAGLRMEGQGELEEAWTWYRAGLRSSRHVGTHGTVIERLIGIAIYATMSNAIKGWADHPNLNLDLLKKAFEDVQSINAMTPSSRDAIQAEYFSIARFLDDPNATEWYVHHNAGVPGTKDDRQTPFDKLRENVLRLVLREPERSRRVLRLVVANWLAVADLTPDERTNRRFYARIDTPIYNPPAGAPKSASALSPKQIDEWLASTRFTIHLLPAFDNVNQAELREAGMRASLVIHLAERLYTRERGKPPESPEALVGPYLKALPSGYVPPSSFPGSAMTK